MQMIKSLSVALALAVVASSAYGASSFTPAAPPAQFPTTQPVSLSALPALAAGGYGGAGCVSVIW